MPTSRRDSAEIRKRGAGVVAPYERTLQKALLFKYAFLCYNDPNATYNREG